MSAGLDRRLGNWMQTAHGRKAWPLDPRPSDIHIDDIAHHLAHICRFNGACSTLYCVAEHSVRVSLIVERWLILDYLHDLGRPLPWFLRAAFWCAWHGLPFGLWTWMFLAEMYRPVGSLDVVIAALHHDDAEAYLADVPRPVKPDLPGYKEIEQRNERTIAERLGLIYPWPGIVKQADDAALATEARALMGGECAGKWHLRHEPLPWTIRPWSPKTARRRFLFRWRTLSTVSA